MTEELKKAINKVEKLPDEKQNYIAELILDEIKWDYTFQSSLDKLSTLAEEALLEYKAGKTKPLDTNP
jgi:hypothetical protein